MKKFIQFLKDLSVKQTIVLASFGIALFITLLIGVSVSLILGQPMPLELFMAIWFSGLVSTIFVGLILLIILYLIIRITSKIKTKAKNKKAKKQDKKKATS